MDTYLKATTENSEEPFLVLEDQKMYSYLCLIKHCVIKMYMSGGIVLYILNLGIRWTLGSNPVHFDAGNKHPVRTGQDSELV